MRESSKPKKSKKPLPLPLGHDYGAGRGSVVHEDKRSKRKRVRRKDWSDDGER